MVALDSIISPAGYCHLLGIRHKVALVRPQLTWANDQPRTMMTHFAEPLRRRRSSDRPDRQPVIETVIEPQRDTVPQRALAVPAELPRVGILPGLNGSA